MGVAVKLVGAGKPDAKLGETQFAVVAAFLDANIANVGHRHAEFPGVGVLAIIVVVVLVVEQVDCGGELVAAIESHSCGIDTDGRHVAAYRP